MNYTSIEQSKKLLELGLSPESADMFYGITTSIITGEEVIGKLPMVKWDDMRSLKYIPCWSVGALLEIMPKEKEVPFPDSNPFIGYGDNTYRCVYLNGDWESSHQTIGDSLLEAAYNMVVWLLENNYIKQ